MIEAGFPPGAVNVVTGFGAEAGQPLVDHPLAWRRSRSPAAPPPAPGSPSATAGRFIGSTLELGGKSPNIVFDDANVANAATGVVAGIFAAAGPDLHRGQPGVRPPRRLRRAARAGRATVPAASGWATRSTTTTELGPLAFEDQRDKVAVVRRPAAAPKVPGCSPVAEPPTAGLGGLLLRSRPVLVDVDNQMRVVREEIFGPVAAIMPFDTEEEVVASGQRHRVRAAPPGCGRRTWRGPTGWPVASTPAPSG